MPSRTTAIAIVILIIIIIIILIVAFYSCQHHFVFCPSKLPRDYKFHFDILENKFEERYFWVDYHTRVHGILFQSITDTGLPVMTHKKPSYKRKLVFYLHGNAGNLALWGNIAPIYTYHGYDIFILDYRGFGKSQGYVLSEKQIHEDIQIVYDEMLKEYDEENIVVAGYSIGTGLAARLASNNNPKALIMNAPYYSITRLIKQKYPFVPKSLVKFKFETYKFVTCVECPIYIFHSEDDKMIPIKHSWDLSKKFKDTDQIFILQGAGHSEINQNKKYQKILSRILD